MVKIVDKTNLVFGNLFVRKHIGFNKYGNAVFECVCSCGNIINVAGGHLNNEKPHTISCGCVRFMNRFMYTGLHENLSGKQFSRLKVIEEIPCPKLKGKHVYSCICQCGKKIEADYKDLRTGHTQSCGCLNADIMKIQGKKQSKIQKRSDRGFYMKQS